MQYSAVLPIHNEQELLPYSLPSIYQLQPDETVLLFDRCTDNSLQIAHKIATKHHMVNKTRFVNVLEESDYQMRSAYLRVLGCTLAKHNTILYSNADLILDPKIKEYIKSVTKYGLITFEYKDYPINWRMNIKRLISKILPFDWLGAVRLFDRRLMFKHENLEELKSLESEDTHLANAIREHKKTLYIHTNTTHLRPRENQKRHYLRGRLYAQFNRSFLLTVASAISMLRFGLLKGYIHERFKYTPTKTPYLQYSVFVPIHNSQDFLKYSLPSIFKLDPPEVVLYFDNCQDNSHETARQIVDKLKPGCTIKYIHNHKQSPTNGYNFQTAYVKTEGIKHCTYDWVLNCDADMMLQSEKMKPHLQSPEYKCVCFDRIEYPIDPRFEVIKPLSHFNKPRTRGLMFFNKKLLFRHMDLKKLKKIYIAVDTFIFETIKNEYKVKFVRGKNIHLDPHRTKEKDYQYGIHSWNVLRRKFIRILVSKSITLRFSYLRGYIHARFCGRVNKKVMETKNIPLRFPFSHVTYDGIWLKVTGTHKTKLQYPAITLNKPQQGTPLQATATVKVDVDSWWFAFFMEPFKSNYANYLGMDTRAGTVHYARTRRNALQTATNIDPQDWTNETEFSIIHDKSDVYFYINGAEIAHHTTNISQQPYEISCCEPDGKARKCSLKYPQGIIVNDTSKNL